MDVYWNLAQYLAIFTIQGLLLHFNAPNRMISKTQLAIILIILAGISRFLPHPGNFTPLCAISLFAGAMLNGRAKSYLYPLGVMFMTDLLLNNFIYKGKIPGTDGIVWKGSLYVYASILLITYLGKQTLVQPRWLQVIGVTLVGSVCFYLITNFGSWQFDPAYPKTFAGLMQSYIAGIPFFRNAILGDLMYSSVLFGLFAWVTKSRLVAQIA